MSMETLEPQDAQSSALFNDNEAIAAFFMQKHDQCLAFEHVQETSLSGLMLKIRYNVEPGSRWTLSCVVGDWRATVNATVSECIDSDQNKNGSYWAKLTYDCNSEKERNDAMLFFMALREYIDRYF